MKNLIPSPSPLKGEGSRILLFLPLVLSKERGLGGEVWHAMRSDRSYIPCPPSQRPNVPFGLYEAPDVTGDAPLALSGAAPALALLAM